MSGIATNTASWVSQAGSMGVACTRKTDWGLLDKWAVHVGGGLTHRLSRADALMIKENDLAALAPGIVVKVGILYSRAALLKYASS